MLQIGGALSDVVQVDENDGARARDEA